MSDHGGEISASLMCVDYRRFEAQLDVLYAGGVTRLHLDFGDTHFVPTLILGTEIFSLIGSRDDFLVETHLMIQEPARLIRQFADGSDYIIIHHEAAADPLACLRQIRGEGAKAGIALRPETPAAAVEPLLDELDQVLVMTVEPGYAGGRFIPEMIEKVRALRAMANARRQALELSVDGSINLRTIPALREAGADVFVGGSSGLFTGGDLALTSRQLVSAVR